MADFKELIDSIRKEQVTLFLGSGFSRKAGAPMANAIVTSLKESMPVDIKDDFRDETHLDLISEEFEQIYGRESLINKLEEIFKFMPTDTSDHTCLTKIPHIRHIITTNYDTLIEDAFGPDSCYVVRTTDDCVNLPKDKTIVYKIHGDFTKKDNIILTKQDYTNFFSSNNEPLLWKYIQSHILTNDMLFIGYSLEDSNIFTLIQEIRKQVKVDTRKYFLIAPELYHHKIERLAKTKIKYFNAKAEDLFPVLFETLNKKIKSDYQRKYICLDTFRRYSNQHFLQPIVEEGQKENKIIRFDSTGKTDVKINVSGLSKEVAETIMSQDTTLYNSFLPRTHIPAYMITQDMMKELNISINGLTIADYDDCKNLFISPTVETIKTIITIPSIKFKEKIKFQRYNPNKEQVCFLLETEPYTFKLVFSFLPNKVLNCTCNVNLKENCKNLQEAIKWMDFVIALWSQEEFIIKAFDKVPIRFPKTNLHELKQFKKIKKYYENTSDIEDLYNIEFETIETYSEDNFQISELLIHSHHEHNLRENMLGQECTVEVGQEQEGVWDEIKVGETKYSLALTQSSLEQIVFNGQKFNIKNKNTIIPQCQILEIQKENGKMRQITFKILSEYVFIKYTNRALTEFEEFSQLKR